MKTPTPKVGDTWYRYDGWVELDGTMTAEDWVVEKVTAKGAWVRAPWDVGGKITQRFVLLNAAKRWAYPSKDDALYSFIRRKQRQIKIMAAQLERVQNELASALAYRAKASSTQ